MEGEEEKEKSEHEGEGEVEPPPEEPPPEEPPPEEPPPPPPPEEPPPEEPPPEEPPPEEPPPQEPPPEEPPAEEPPPEEVAPPPEEPTSPAPEVSALASKGASLAPVAEEQPAQTSQVTIPSSHPAAKSTSALKQKLAASEKSLAGITGSLKSFLKSTTDVEPSQPSAKALARRDPSRLSPEGCGAGGGGIAIPGLGNFSCRAFLHKRSPFIHNPPQPEERRDRIINPRTPREYIINLREDLADFQESHGLPRTRDYSFLSLGLALAQETARALCSLFLMFAELFPIVAIVSLLVRFALDKLIEILETTEPVPKVKKSIIFALEMLVIIIPLWIFIGTIIIPLLALALSIFKRMFRFKGRGRRCAAKGKTYSAFDYFRFF